MRLAIICSHPIQYYSPLFRTLAEQVDLHVFFGHRPDARQQGAGFGAEFEWDVDLTAGFPHSFLANVSSTPDVERYGDCDTPEIGRRLAEGRFDAVLVLGWRLKCFIQAALAARRMGIPVLVRGDSHLDTPRSPLKRAVKAALYPPLLRLFSAALYVGQKSLAYYQHYRFPEERLFFSPHCIDNAWFAERATPQARRDLRARLGLDETDQLALFAGKLTPIKQPLDVVEICALAAKSRPGLHLALAGAGELEDVMAARAKALNLPLHRLGFQNQGAMPSIYAAADALILPGRETWGLVCNEALACGTPILVSDSVGCWPDLVSDGAGGTVYRVGDNADGAERLNSLLASPPSPTRMRLRSEAYSLTAAADGVLAAMAAMGRKR